MTAPVLADALGPRARRRTHLASAVAAAFLLAAGWVAVNRLQDKGQLEWRLWEPFTQWAVIRFLLDGLWMTLKLGAASMVLALTIGAFLALGRLARSAPVRWLAGAYVEFFRAVPLLLLILFTVIGLPKYGIGIDDFWLVVMALVAYNSAILGEIFRAGILSLDRGQGQAALAIGLSDAQAMRLVVLPQALRRMIPAVVSQLITLLKDTSLATIIIYPGLLRQFQLASKPSEIGQPGADLQGYVLCAVVFIAVNLCLSTVARRLEVRQRRRYRTGGAGLAGTEELVVLSVVDPA